MSTGYAAQSYSTAYSPQQQPYAPTSATPVQYSAQYPQTPTAYYAAPYSTANAPIKEQSPPAELPAAPELTDVTPEVATRSIQKLLSFELKGAGFESAELQALERLEKEVVTFVTGIFQLAHEYSNLANRAAPIATDLVRACEGLGLHTNDLHKTEVASRKRKRDHIEFMNIVPQLVPATSRSPSPELLSSDDEGSPATVPLTLRSHPYYLPPLPPKHTYLRTPISPPRKAALPSLEKKLKTSGLVQESLKNLLLATEESHEDNGDGEILGAVVNWEVTSYKKKRWKVGS